MNAVVTFVRDLFEGEGTPYLVIGAILIVVFLGNMSVKLARSIHRRAGGRS